MARIIHCIINNLICDQRLHKIALTLHKEHEVEVVGIKRHLWEAPLRGRPYTVRRLWVPAKKGPLFFLLANVVMFMYLLLRRKWEAVLACDLHILPACWVAGFLRGKVVLLDSRELYTQTPFLVSRPFKRRVWELAEQLFYPRTRYIITVSPPIAEHFQKKYGKPVWVIYNLPLRGVRLARPHLEERLLLYQGMLHPQRGLEELVNALKIATGWRLWIVGDGPIRRRLEEIVLRERLGDRVVFFGMVPFEKVEDFTLRATLGVSGELPTALNHRYALPNKVFDYLQAGIPVIAGEAPLIQAIVRKYNAGCVVEPWTPSSIAQTLKSLEMNRPLYDQWVEGARKAASILHWEQQEGCLRYWVRCALEGREVSTQDAVQVCERVVEIGKAIYCVA
ncbi:MAG: glycosyltransferase [Bacteroidia bacterium]|nr:glycosyltransferase [Bacteroidia bacterium]MDW8134085.1 glycosyltransferase [Bacteroidia bacterium]